MKHKNGHRKVPQTNRGDLAGQPAMKAPDVLSAPDLASVCAGILYPYGYTY